MSSTTYASRNVTFQDFDPNKQFSDKPLYGLFDGHKFKTFAARGPLINAVHAAGQAKAYVQTPAGWSLIALKSDAIRGDACDKCGDSIKDSFKDAYYTRSRSWVFRRAPNGRIADPLELLHVCKECRKWL